MSGLVTKPVLGERGGTSPGCGLSGGYMSGGGYECPTFVTMEVETVLSVLKSRYGED